MAINDRNSIGAVCLHKTFRIRTNRYSTLSAISYFQWEHAHLRHDYVLGLPDQLSFSFEEGLQETKILYIPSMLFNTVYDLLYNPVSHFVTQRKVLVEDESNCFSLKQLNKNKAS